jgi:zinc and cadmium transporter
MSRSSLFIFVTLVLDGLAGLSGGLLSDRWLIRHQAALIGFAAGAILGAVFLDVLPESVSGAGPNAFTWSFAGFVAMAILEWLIGYHHHQHGVASPALPPSLLLSDGMHNIADGAAVAAGFLISVKVGVAVAIAIIAHEVPQEVGDYAVLRSANWGRVSALISLACVQLTAFIGAALVMFAAERVQRLTAIVLSIASGTFLYIGATDLLPEIHSGHTASSRAERMFGFAAGIALIATVSRLASGVG